MHFAGLEAEHDPDVIRSSLNAAPERALTVDTGNTRSAICLGMRPALGERNSSVEIKSYRVYNHVLTGKSNTRERGH